MADSETFQMRFGSLLSLRTRPGPWLERLAPGLSQLAPCRQLTHGPAQWLRLGPDEWWCWQDEAASDVAALAQTISQAAGQEFHACVDLSDAHACCLLPAPAEPLLSAGCELDFERLPADFAGRSRLGPFTVVLATQQGAMRLWTESSLGQSLGVWLTQTAALQRR